MKYSTPSKTPDADEDARKAFIRDMAVRLAVATAEAVDLTPKDCKWAWKAAKGMWDAKPEDC